MKKKSLVRWAKSECWFLGLVKTMMEVKNIPFWLLEDSAFIESITFGASCLYCEEDFLHWLDKFLNGLSEHPQELADRVSYIRIVKEIEQRYILADRNGKREIEKLLKST